MEQLIKNRTKNIAIEIIKIVNLLPRTTSAWIICKQLIRSGTSVGANYRAACRGKSNADFLHKLTMVEEEADETIYWLELLEETGLISSSSIAELKKEVDEILCISVASIKTLKAKKQEALGNK